MPAKCSEARAETRPRGRWFVWSLLSLLAFVAFVAAAFWPTGSFVVGGVPFRVWVAQRPDFSIEVPLAAVGTNAIPHLIRILREPPESPESFKRKNWIWSKLPRRVQRWFRNSQPVPQWQLKRTALFALRFFGPEAKDALPEVLRVGRNEADRMVRAGALVAALQIAPGDPGTFQLWREEWNGTNFSRHDLAIYLHAARYAFPAAVPLLLQEVENQSKPVTFLEAFEYFGEAARPAVPHMLRVAAGETFHGNMTTVLRRLGMAASDAAPVLAEMLNDTNAGWVASILLVLKATGAGARPAVPRIEPLITNKDSTVRMLAAATLARLDGKAEIAVPILFDVLEGRLPPSSEAYVPVDLREKPGLVTAGPQASTLLLGELGPAARAVLPALETRLGDPNEVTRILTAQAIWRINRNKQIVLPALMNVLNALQPPAPGSSSGDYGMIMAIEAIAEMGAEAKEAIPALERLRSFSMLARRMANEALIRIAPESP